MNYTILTLALVLLLSKNAYSQSNDPEIFHKKYMKCLFDRGVNPPNIPTVDVEHCLKEWRAYVGSMWLSPVIKNKMVNHLTKYAVNEGRMAVLTVRRISEENK